MSQRTDSKEKIARESANKILALPPGTVLKERFLLTRLIATGGTSHIYKARDMLASMDEHLPNELVVKVAKDVLSDSATAAEIALHEALSTRHLAHPNIVRIYDFDCDKKHCFVTMELLQGESLTKRLARSLDKRLPYKQSIRIAESIADGLSIAHHQGVIHSDIKPDNINIDPEDHVKIIDFGTARPDSQTTRRNLQSSEADYIGYTPSYASPQTLRGETATVSDDVYSFSCVLYEMLSGQHPFDRATSDTAEREKLKAHKPRAINFWQWLVLKKGLSFDSTKRYSDIKRFHAHFKTARHGWTVIFTLASLFAVIGWGYVQSSQFLNQHLQHDKSMQIVNNEINWSQNFVNKVRHAPELKRLDLLGPLNKQSPLVRHLTLAELRNDITRPVIARVQDQIYRFQGIPDFISLNKLVKKAKQYYPDSAELYQAHQLIKREQKEQAEALLLQYREHWQTTRFTTEEARVLKSLHKKIITMDMEIPEIDTEVRQRYLKTLVNAINQFDYLGINRLIAFRNLLPALAPGSLDKQINFSSLQIEAAQSLAHFALTPVDKRSRYPLKAATIFWGPYFVSLEPAIKKAWNFKELENIKQQLQQLAEKIPATYPPLVNARQLLAEQYRSKARYYKRKHLYPKQMKQLNKIADQLLNQGQ